MNIHAPDFACIFLQEEFVGGIHLCNQIKKAERGRANWQRLFEPYDFFRSFKNYLQVCGTASCAQHAPIKPMSYEPFQSLPRTFYARK